jgi:2-keto-3-deoxy-L-rhamnonate aldolase RhmA
MTESTVLQKLARGETVLTAKACYADPELVELLASAGFDAIWLCLEHKRLDPALVYSLLQACRLGGAEAYVRVKPSNYSDVLWLLEGGARGLMLPRVRHPDEVRAFVAATKFPPLGQRGCDAVHVDSDFGRTPTPEYVAAGNRTNFLVVQIEEPEVVPHIDEIAAMPGVDVLFVGPGDLSLGYGNPAQYDAPEVTAVVRAVAEACRRHGKHAAIPCAADQVDAYREIGYTFLNVYSDYRGVVAGARQALGTARPTQK